jgi:hypothetical protein
MSNDDGLPRVDMKYLRLREECATLLEIAKELEILANRNKRLRPMIDSMNRRRDSAIKCRLSQRLPGL